MSTPVRDTVRPRVPVRTIAASMGMVLATVLLLLLVRPISRVLIWLVIAGFFAVALDRLADLVGRRLHVRRWLATLLVFLVVLLTILGLVALFVALLLLEGSKLVDRAPGYLDDARSGPGHRRRAGEAVQVRELPPAQLRANPAERVGSGRPGPPCHRGRGAEHRRGGHQLRAGLPDGPGGSEAGDRGADPAARAAA